MAWLLAAAWPAAAGLFLAAGWLSAALITAASEDYTLHDTYYVVAHWRYVVGLVGTLIVVGLVYALMAASRSPYRFWLGVAHLAATVVGLGLWIAPGLVLATTGTPRRYADYDMESFRTLALLGSTAQWVFLVGVGLFVVLLADVVLRILRARGA